MLSPLAVLSQDRSDAVLVGVLREYGLYAAGYDEREASRMMGAVLEELGDQLRQEHEATPERLEPWSGDESLGTDWSELYPMCAGPGEALHCSGCEMDVQRGWGCTCCVEFHCYACVSGHGHRCSGGTLAHIGAAIGVSASAVRQKVNGAIKKLKRTMHNSESIHMLWHQWENRD